MFFYIFVCNDGFVYYSISPAHEKKSPLKVAFFIGGILSDENKRKTLKQKVSRGRIYEFRATS